MSTAVVPRSEISDASSEGQTHRPADSGRSTGGEGSTGAAISKPVWQRIESDKTLQAQIGPAYVKVRSHLSRYARTLGKTHEELTLLHISTEKAELTPGLVKSVERRLRRRGTTDERHVLYTGEILSRIRGMIPVLLGAAATRDAAAAESALAENLPASVRPIVIHLTRVGCSGKSQDRSKLPLTVEGREALKVLVNVAQRHDTESPEELLLAHTSELNQEVYASVEDAARWQEVQSLLSRVRKKMGIRPKRTSASLPEEELPPLLKSQLGRYTELAPTGAYSEPELLEAGLNANVIIRRHEASTIRANKTVFLQLLGELAAEGHDISGLSVEDLMRVEPAALPDGKVVSNIYLCPFRERQKRATGMKVRGRDSTRFEKTLRVIEVVAEYNGIFEHHGRFKETYVIHQDRWSLGQRKKEKKDAFPAKWLDENLERLRPMFDSIVKARTFRKVPDDLGLCLIYVRLRMLRHTAVRQQSVRNCRKDWNIFFLGRNAVTFRWREGEIKNDKDFSQTVKRAHVNTCEPLVDGLFMYRDHILPFLEGLAADQHVDTRGEFFLHASQGFNVRPFSKTSPSLFCLSFNLLCRKFLDFTGVPAHMRPKFSPHVIRGMAADYYHDDLGMSTESTSRVLGDTVRTTDEDYLQKNRVDATSALDEAEERAAAIKEKRLRESGRGVPAAPGGAGAEAQALKEALNDSLERERRLAEEVAELKAKYDQISSREDT